MKIEFPSDEATRAALELHMRIEVARQARELEQMLGDEEVRKLHSSIFGLDPLRSVYIVGEDPSVYDRFGLMFFTQLPSELLEYETKPRIMSTKELASLESKGFMRNVWSIGSPYSNEYTTLLTTKSGKDNNFGLDLSLRPELPFYFHVDGSRTIVDKLDEKHREFVDALNAELQKQHPEYSGEPVPKQLSDPFCMIVPPEKNSGGIVGRPRFNVDAGTWDEDYFMILKLDTLNREDASYGLSSIVVAGCHGLGTEAALIGLYNKAFIEEIAGKVNRQQQFQLIGIAYRGCPPRIEHLELI